MSKKIESERDIPQETDEKIEIEFIDDKGGKPQKKTTARPSPKGESAKELKSLLKKWKTKCEHLEKEKEELKDEYLRIAADKENLRKRLEREKEDFLKYALSESLKEFLVILDNLERAMESENTQDCESLRAGIILIHKQYVDVLKKQGVHPIKIEDNEFDPHLHQAFITEESAEISETIVDEELQRGYMLHDRLLRPSLVKVLVPQKEEDK